MKNIYNGCRTNTAPETSYDYVRPLASLVTPPRVAQ